MPVPGYAQLVDALAKDDLSRMHFLKSCLSRLQLVVEQHPKLLPGLSDLHLSASKCEMVEELFDTLQEIISHKGDAVCILGEADTFILEQQSSSGFNLTSLTDALPALSDTGVKHRSNVLFGDYHQQPKRILLHGVQWPDLHETPHFNHLDYHSSLQQFQRRSREAETLGNYLLYGEVLTSTNTIIDKLVFACTHALTLTNYTGTRNCYHDCHMA